MAPDGAPQLRGPLALGRPLQRPVAGGRQAGGAVRVPLDPRAHPGGVGRAGLPLGLAARSRRGARGWRSRGAGALRRVWRHRLCRDGRLPGPHALPAADPAGGLGCEACARVGLRAGGRSARRQPRGAVAPPAAGWPVPEPGSRGAGRAGGAGLVRLAGRDHPHLVGASPAVPPRWRDRGLLAARFRSGSSRLVCLCAGVGQRLPLLPAAARVRHRRAGDRAVPGTARSAHPDGRYRFLSPPGTHHGVRRRGCRGRPRTARSLWLARRHPGLAVGGGEHGVRPGARLGHPTLASGAG